MQQQVTSFFSPRKYQLVAALLETFKPAKGIVS